MAQDDDQLTEKQRMFCREYIVDLNGAQAAIRAGYSEAAAKEQASRLLTNANIQTFVQQLMAERVDRVEVKADTILRELLRIGLSDIGKAFNENGKLLPIHEIPEDTRRVIVGFDVYEEYAGVGEDRESIAPPICSALLCGVEIVHSFPRLTLHPGFRNFSPASDGQSWFLS